MQLLYYMLFKLNLEHKVLKNSINIMWCTLYCANYGAF